VTAADNPARLRARRSLWIAASCMLALVGTIAAVLGAHAVGRTDADKERLAFHLAADDITSTLKLAILHEEDLVVNASAFVTGTPNLTPLRFDRWLQSVKALQRYPELLNVGLVARVPAGQLARFEAALARNPVEPLGPNHPGPKEPFSVFPAGPRPYYCFAVAGQSRDLSSYLPSGLDYCALASGLAEARDSGQTSYAPFRSGATTTLGVQTPVYRGGLVPQTVAAKDRAFVGWLGELLEPTVLLSTALQGHPNTAVSLRYDSGASHIAFQNRAQPHQALVTTIDLHNGWTVRTAAAAPANGIFGDLHALTLLIGGILLSFLFAALMYVQGTGRIRALSLVAEQTRELSHQALHDALTGLPNRALVLDRAEQMLARTARAPGMVAGALFVDVDGFKHVNDNLGHAAGDILLRTVGERLQAAVRDQDTVGRLGGDEFVVLVESSSEVSTADGLADRLVAALRDPVDIGHHAADVSVTVSIGVAVGQYSTPDGLLRDADLALYAAKAAGRDRYTLFDASMHADVEGRVELELDLAGALQGEQFFLLYQPIFDLASGRIEGVEALLRWRHPVRGIIAPDEFIPLAEESGMIVPIGRWVLREACRQARAWAGEGGRRVGMSVNVSAYELGREDFAGDVRSALEGSGLDPAALMIEITETTVMRDVGAACEHLREIKALGVSVAVDDFGTGYASLSQLQKMPADILKVDRSFISALAGGAQSRDLLQAILGVGHAMSLKVIAEGIETEDQLRTVTEMGCEMAQGFLIGRPGPAEVIEGLLVGASRGAAVTLPAR
jgi:diguanylate cyclase (GGDEF)-like protein